MAFIDFFTNNKGLFAAITALLGFLVAIVTLVQPFLKKRRENAAAIPDLCFSELQVDAPPPHSEAGSVSFQLMNARGGKSVLRDLDLIVSAHGPTELPKMTEAAAPVPEFTYTVTLSPGVDHYDVRKKEFGSSPPHSYVAGEVEAFRVELRSTEPQWYEFEFLVRWYDARHPDKPQELRSTKQRIDFLPDVTDLI